MTSCQVNVDFQTHVSVSVLHVSTKSVIFLRHDSFIPPRSLCVINGFSMPTSVLVPLGPPQGSVLDNFSIPYRPTRLNMVLYSLPILCWISCTLMNSRSTRTVWHLTL